MRLGDNQTNGKTAKREDTNQSNQVNQPENTSIFPIEEITLRIGLNRIGDIVESFLRIGIDRTKDIHLQPCKTEKRLF